MSDRIAVMSGGRVEQNATPERMYEEPETVFVADFLGVSNLMQVRAEGLDGGACRTKLGDFTLRAACGEVAHHGETYVVIRPERVGIEPPGPLSPLSHDVCGQPFGYRSADSGRGAGDQCGCGVHIWLRRHGAHLPRFHPDRSVWLESKVDRPVWIRQGGGRLNQDRPDCLLR